jgi:hypothetical protein
MSYVKQSALSVCAVLIAVLLPGCGGGGGGGDGGGPITVSGIVVSSTGAPVSGANLILNNTASSLVTTGADGKFSFANVTPPYVLTIKTGTALAEYRNLTRSNPQVVTSTGGVTYSTSLAGNVTGPTYPLPANQFILIGASNGVAPLLVTANSVGAYSSSNFIWTGSPINKTTDLVALRFSYVAPQFTSFIQTGKRSGVVLNDGVGQTGLDIALSAGVTTANSIFNFALGAYTTSGNGGFLNIKANGATFLIPTLTVPSGTNLLLPSDGAAFFVQGTDAGGNTALRTGQAVLGGTTTIDLPASTVLKNSLPASGATGVSKLPTLSWTPVSGAEIYLVTLSTATQSFAFIIPATSASLTVPDYAALGMALLGSTSYSWRVQAVRGWASSVDATTDPAGAGLSPVALYLNQSVDLYGSASTSFTTAP